MLAIQQALLDASSSCIWYFYCERKIDFQAYKWWWQFVDWELNLLGQVMKTKVMFYLIIFALGLLICTASIYSSSSGTENGAFRIWASCSPQLWCPWYSWGEKGIEIKTNAFACGFKCGFKHFFQVSEWTNWIALFLPFVKVGTTTVTAR